jgi:hypothetical protein
MVIVGAGWAILTLNPPTESMDGEGVTLVKEGRADIVTSSLAERTSTQKFASALENLGHEAPRVYDYNGNTVYFSTREVMGKRPEEILQEYQHEFVVQGINSKQYLVPALAKELNDPDSQEKPSEDLMEMYEAAANGEILPQLVTSTHMSMGGAEYMHPSKGGAEVNQETMASRTAKLERYGDKFRAAYIACGKDANYFDTEVARRVEDAEGGMVEAAKKVGMALEKEETGCSGGTCNDEQAAYEATARKMEAMKQLFDEDRSLQGCEHVNALFQEFAEESTAQFESRVRAIRQIEAFYDEESGSSAITALWSDEDFDLALAASDDLPESAARTSALGKCDGCMRAMAFKGHGRESNYGADVIRVKKAPVDVMKHYIDDMAQKGWKLSELHDAIGEVYASQDEPLPQNARWMHFAKGTQHITIHVTYDEETGMTTLTSNTTD